MVAVQLLGEDYALNHLTESYREIRKEQGPDMPLTLVSFFKLNYRGSWTRGGAVKAAKQASERGTVFGIFLTAHVQVSQSVSQFSQPPTELTLKQLPFFPRSEIIVRTVYILLSLG